MDKDVSEKFENLWDKFPDELKNGEYEFKDNNFLDSYCYKNECKGDLEKINAGCLFLLNKFFGSSGLSNKTKNNIIFVDYIMIWLIYMLSLKDNPNKNSLKHFYTTYINSDLNYKNTVDYVEGCNNFKDIIVKRHTLTNDDMDNKIISELYNAFKLLCEMYTDFDENTSNCAKCSEKAFQFVENYKKLNEYPNNTNGSSYNKILSTLSTDYDNFKIYCGKKGGTCNNFPSLPPIKTEENDALSSGLISEDASSSLSITNKLFTVLSIFGAIAFLLGVSYKYSLFGLRKRFQKQKLREKLKNIKKRINH
ncbi:PIR protein [Plasmodium yoelii]|uniref:Yir4 protein n=3 Tax=Plasmodium yoelii TaxID=5861 RepID=Q7RLD2_PLAYO|nr:PIR protein [Plasmodium yoelii]EAA22086.1 putative yir4 protein [Plasmodium yoelii yoelii]WBY56997.1 PIR protein [Plasmodium yoelii yoelii]CDS44744.1 YIR protein [Plasmodium yoelii]VTZ77860.1 PIR protein [Plasmodium yoelii]|eukprot:XP_022810853.1 PIR protein [Plasmodium yoelii]